MSDTPYPENEGQTHFEGCYRERGHHNCAMREIMRLQAERSALEDKVEELRNWLQKSVIGPHYLGRSREKE